MDCSSLLLASFLALRPIGALGLATSYFIAYTAIVMIEAVVTRRGT